MYVCMFLFGYVLSLSLEWRMRGPFKISLSFALFWSRSRSRHEKKKFATGVATLERAG